MFTAPRLSALTILAATAWFGVVSAGFSGVWQYAYTAGPAAITAPAWPGLTVNHDKTVPTLVMVLHPECACSRASVAELARVMTFARGRVAPVVLFSTPLAGEMSEQNDLLAAAGRIPGVVVARDPLGVEAARFGARVSGQVFLYAPSGQLMFDGGITASRGHDGDNDGVRAILAALDDRPVLTRTPVFGCLLRGSAAS